MIPLPTFDESAVVDFIPSSQLVVNIPNRMRSQKVDPEPSTTRVRFGPPQDPTFPPTIMVGPSIGAEQAAMKKRADHVPSACVGDNFKRGFKALLAKTYPFEQIEVTSTFLDDWMAQLDSTKAEKLTHALNEPIYAYDHTRKTVIVKQEVLNKPPGSAPRVVYSNRDSTNLLMGAITNELSKRMTFILNRHNPLNQGNTVIYTSGMTLKEIANSVVSDSGPRVESDFSAFDSTQSAAIRKYEAMFYKKLGAPDYYVRAIASSTKWSVTSTRGFDYAITGQRLSGECPTATGNSFVQCCETLGALEAAGVERSVTHALGDDSLIVVKSVVSLPKVVAAIDDGAKESGMTRKTAVVPTHEATYLQKRYVRTNNGGVAVPKVGRVLSRLPWMPEEQQKRIPKKDYFAGKFLSAAYEHQGIAPLGELFRDAANSLSSTPYIEDAWKTDRVAKDPAAILRSLGPPGDLYERFDDDAVNQHYLSVYGLSGEEILETYKEVVLGIIKDLEGNLVANDYHSSETLRLVYAKDCG